MVNRRIDLPKNFIKKIHQKVGQKNSSKNFVKKFVKKIGHSICKNKGEKNRQKFTSKRDQPYVCILLVSKSAPCLLVIKIQIQAL